MAINTIVGLATTPGSGLIYFSTGHYVQVRMLNLSSGAMGAVAGQVVDATGEHAC